MIQKWMPQSDILAHKNIVLFISHGGLFGNMEAMDRGVPILFIPLYGDQYRNALRSERRGVGVKVVFNELTTHILLEKIKQLTNTSTYMNRAKEMSALFRDNPIHPMDEATFWIEYVCRHKGALHLRSHAVDMPWYTYLLLDIIVPFILFVLAAVAVVYKVIRSLFGNKITSRSDFETKKFN